MEFYCGVVPVGLILIQRCPNNTLHVITTQAEIIKFTRKREKMLNQDIKSKSNSGQLLSRHYTVN